MSARFFGRLHRGYERSLGWALLHPRLMLAATLATVGLNVYLYVVTPKGFFPQQDTGRLSGSVQASQDISFQSMQGKLTQIVDVIAKDPAVESVTGFTGGGGGGGSSRNTARMFVALKPRGERPSADQVVAGLRRGLGKVAGAPAFLQVAQDLRVGGKQSNAQYQYTLQGDTVADLETWAPKLLAKLRTTKEIADVSSDQQISGLEAGLVIDRPTASRLGITPQLLDETLYDAFGQRQVSVIYTARNQYHVVMEVAPDYWQRPESLDSIRVRTPSGESVPLGSFTHYEPNATTLAVNHQGQFPAVTLSFNLAPRVALGQAVAAVENAAQSLGLPSSIRRSFSGTAQAFQASLASQPVLVAGALIAVYIVLGILYESFVHPITILSTLPSAGVGAILALLATGTDLSVIAMIGIVLLIGIVKKNAIMMIDFAIETERREHVSSREAIQKAALLRFRPILMTTMAALLGAVPLAVGGGAGSELRRPLGIAIVGGLVVSQALTLYTTPVVYLHLDRLALWSARVRSRVGLRPADAHVAGRAEGVA